MKQTWVIDTNILYCAARSGKRCSSSEFAFSRDSLKLLIVITEQHQVAEDTNGRVAAEYRRAWLKMTKNTTEYPTHVAVHALWESAFSRAHFRGQRRLPDALRQKAKNVNMKTEGDIAFIEAASATADRLLASEDSDFSDDLRKELLGTPSVGVRVLGVLAALAHAAP